MQAVFETIAGKRIVPVIKIEDPDRAVPLARALLSGGLPIAEITFRTAAAAQAMRAIVASVPGVLVGAGTVLTTGQVDIAIDSGASFVVTPGFNPRVVDYCLSRGIAVIPGVNSPSQVEMGLERGLEILKFFPAEASGGVKMLKALNGPYPGVRFIPTGGIGPDNLSEYLGLSCVLACGGSWMVKDEFIAAGKFQDIEEMTRRAVQAAAACK
ncbi:MAG: bifunctional 4-hydroxy-2-oxoglutarate aldolase/2-dehydro-3-deoxy-phosphogluconate aldolase, partial [Rectinemataceae bacterium]